MELGDLLQLSRKTHKEELPGLGKAEIKIKAPPRYSNLPPPPPPSQVQLGDGRKDMIFACQMFKGLITLGAGENRASVTL